MSIEEREMTPIEKQAAGGAIVYEGKVLQTTFDIAAAAKRCDSAKKAAQLLEAAKPAGGGPELVLSVVRNMLKGDPCAQYFRLEQDVSAPALTKPDMEAT